MHRSSDAIGNISGALAKAQAELTNPETPEDPMTTPERSAPNTHRLPLPRAAPSRI